MSNNNTAIAILRDANAACLLNEDELRHAEVALNSHDGLLAALKRAERFLSGFEDDETQSGIGDLLRQTRAEIAKAEARS